MNRLEAVSISTKLAVSSVLLALGICLYIETGLVIKATVALVNAAAW